MGHRRRMAPYKKVLAKKLRKNPTPAEKKLWTALRKRGLGVKFTRQSPMVGYIADFYCPSLKLVIEVDSKSHDMVYDKKRDNDLKLSGYSTIRIRNEEVLKNFKNLVKKLTSFIREQQLRSADSFPAMGSANKGNNTASSSIPTHSDAY